MEMTEGMTFGQALAHMKIGAKVQRPGWEKRDSEQYLFIMDFRAGESRRIMVQGEKSAYQWGMRQADVMAEDWKIVEG